MWPFTQKFCRQLLGDYIRLRRVIDIGHTCGAKVGILKSLPCFLSPLSNIPTVAEEDMPSGSQSQSYPSYAHAVKYKITEPPNPDWKMGQKADTTPQGMEWMKGLESGWESIDTSKSEYVPNDPGHFSSGM